MIEKENTFFRKKFIVTEYAALKGTIITGMNMLPVDSIVFSLRFNDKLKRDQTCADPGVDRGSGPPPPEKSKQIYGFLTKLVRTPEKSQCYQTSFQCCANIDTPAKIGILLAGRCWPTNSDISYLLFPHKKIKKIK